MQVTKVTKVTLFSRKYFWKAKPTEIQIPNSFTQATVTVTLSPKIYLEARR